MVKLYSCIILNHVILYGINKKNNDLIKELIKANNDK